MKNKDLYDGKFFYEIIRLKDPRSIQLNGPIDNIHYCTENTKLSNFKGFSTDSSPYGFAQLINGTVVQFFREDEILVTDKEL